MGWSFSAVCRCCISPQVHLKTPTWENKEANGLESEMNGGVPAALVKVFMYVVSKKTCTAAEEAKGRPFASLEIENLLFKILLLQPFLREP